MFKFLVDSEWARTAVMAVLASVVLFSFIGIFASIVKIVKKEWKIWYLIGTVVAFAVSLGLFIFFAIKLGELL